MTPLEVLAKLAGGRRALARVLGITENSIRQWEKAGSAVRAAGHLPRKYNRTILIWAAKSGWRREYVEPWLDRDAEDV